MRVKANVRNPACLRPKPREDSRMAESEEIVIFTSISEEEQAEDLIMGLLDRGLILSGTIFPNVRLYYRWDKAINKDEEFKILLKAKRSNYRKIEEFIQEQHHYIAPEVICIDASFGSPEFRKFIETKSARMG